MAFKDFPLDLRVRFRNAFSNGISGVANLEQLMWDIYKLGASHAKYGGLISEVPENYNSRIGRVVRAGECQECGAQSGDYAAGVTHHSPWCNYASNRDRHEQPCYCLACGGAM